MQRVTQPARSLVAALATVTGDGNRRVFRRSHLSPGEVSGEPAGGVASVPHESTEARGPSRVVQSGTSDPDHSLEARLAALEGSVQEVGEALQGHAAWLTDLERWVTSCVRGLALFGAQPLGERDPGVSGPPDIAGRLLGWMEIQTVMSWIRDAAVVTPGPLVTVTIVTRDRPALLQRAIASVLAQSYSHIDLVVVDDSDGPETAALIRGMDDARVRLVPTPGRRGMGAAFNVGLEAVRGELVAFVDDDNVMHPDWLRSIVWAFDQRPETDALYGARILEDIAATDGTASGQLPACEFVHYDRQRHERANFVDRNTLALRSTRAGVRYDEQLAAAVDWDHSLRLFAAAPPLALPAIACYYSTILPGRVSDQPGRNEAVRTVRSRAHESRPLKVHGHRSASGAGGLESAVRSLARVGSTVTLSARTNATAVEGVGSWRPDLEQALGDAQPDLVLLDSARELEPELALLEARGLPFAVCAVVEPHEPVVGHACWLGPIDAAADIEPALRAALTGWLYARA